MKPLVLILTFLTAAVGAQAPGTLTGAVTDQSGAVLPGVTVSAIGPGSAETVRTSVTDSRGQFRISALPIGVYRVTISLPGFTTIERNRVEVVSGIVTKVDAVMRVGAIDETFTFTFPGLSSKVICGMTMLPVDPRLDAKMRKPVPNFGARPSIQTIQPSICNK